VAVAPPAPVVEAPVSPPAARERPAPAGAAGAPTLEDLITGTWEGLVAGAGVACPVCAAEMAPRWSAGAGVVGGRCGGCGSTLH
jgi:hypothetical protein